MDVSPDVMDVLRVLLKLRDLDEMGDVALLDLASDARIETLQEGQTLKADDHQDRHLYLIEGEVELVAGGKQLHMVTAGTERALLPVFRIKTRGLEARCTDAARLMSLNEATFARYAVTIRPKTDRDISVREYSSPDQQRSLVEDIRQAFYHHEVDLPSMPDVALKISHAVQNQDADFRSIAATVQADPVIAARIVQVANSAMYAGVNRVESVQTAITRIGLQATRAIVMTVVLKNLFTPKSQLIHHRMKTFYEHSIRVAVICHALARRLRGFDPERALLAGLMHDIGVLPLLIQADSRQELNRDPELLEKMIRELGKTVGAMLLKQWEFEPDIVNAALESEDWLRESDSADYCDIVQLAQLHCSMIGGNRIEAPPMNELPAFKRLHLADIDPVKVIEEARQEISELVSMLAA